MRPFLAISFHQEIVVRTDWRIAIAFWAKIGPTPGNVMTFDPADSCASAWCCLPGDTSIYHPHAHDEPLHLELISKAITEVMDEG